jgi:UDP-N-acetyl-D-glucosamine dehydrogenase
MSLQPAESSSNDYFLDIPVNSKGPSSMDASVSAFEVLTRRLDSTEAVIGVIGLGYVGIPLALSGSAAGFSVVGFDVDSDKVQRINRGESYIKHIDSHQIQEPVGHGRFRATDEFSELASVDAILICVPTPLTRHREPDLRFVEATSRAIAQHMRRGQLVVLESTTYPGTTNEIVKPLLEKSGLVCGRDFFLAFSPEREDPGNQAHTTRSIPKVVGGQNAEALQLASILYGKLFACVIPVSSSQTAEAVKLTENIFRSVNIALVNELKVVYEAMGIDIWEVIEAAKSKPFGFMPFYPGPGLGGHCIPIDPFYLTWKAREFDMTTRFIELAGQINMAMPRRVVDRLIEALDAHGGGGLNGSRVLIVGLAYKKNVDDMRESPSLKLIELLEARGARVDYYDPYIPIVPPTREHSELAGRRSIEWKHELIAGYDAVLIATDHDNVDYSALTRAKLVIDTRNACARHGVSANVVKA